MVIVGAGPVGLAVAIAARLHGIACIVVDKREPPFDKACGEGIMPKGARCLTELGVRLGTFAHVDGIHYIDGDHRAEACFAAPAVGVRRTVLSEGLLKRATELGVEVCFDTTVVGLSQNRDNVRVSTTRGDLDAAHVVGADGLHSCVRELAGITSSAGAYMRFAARRHYRIEPWSRFVEVHWADGCEAYLTPVAPDTVGVAILAHGGSLRFDEALQCFPALLARLRDVAPSSRLRGAGPMYHRVHRRYAGRIALVGDAAGYVDALTGEGLTTGFTCAMALAYVIARGQPLAAYEDRYRGITRAYYTGTRLMLAISRQPPLRRHLVALLARAPRLFAAMLERQSA